MKVVAIVDDFLKILNDRADEDKVMNLRIEVNIVNLINVDLN